MLNKFRTLIAIIAATMLHSSGDDICPQSKRMAGDARRAGNNGCYKHFKTLDNTADDLEAVAGKPIAASKMRFSRRLCKKLLASAKPSFIDSPSTFIPISITGVNSKKIKKHDKKFQSNEKIEIELISSTQEARKPLYLKSSAHNPMGRVKHYYPHTISRSF